MNSSRQLYVSLIKGREFWAKERKLSVRRAFSILEVMSALAIMAFGLAAAISGMQIGLRNLDVARTANAISQVMQNEAERIRMYNWDMVIKLPAEATAVTIEQDLKTKALKNGNVSITRTVTTVANYNNTMKKIQLQATWRSIDGQRHDRIYWFLYVQGGLYDYYRS
jgi:prepilin-type N-terminal cleavage/methylation domain-containing protein